MKLSTGSWRLFFKPSLGIAGVGLDHAGPFKIVKPHLPRLDIQQLGEASDQHRVLPEIAASNAGVQFATPSQLVAIFILSNI